MIALQIGPRYKNVVAFRELMKLVTITLGDVVRQSLSYKLALACSSAYTNRTCVLFQVRYQPDNGAPRWTRGTYFPSGTH